MTYLAWAVFVEGPSDAEYLSIVLPRLVESVVSVAEGPVAQIPEQPVELFGLRNRSFDTVASEICRARGAFHLLFVHADTGGRGQEERLGERTEGLRRRLVDRCEFPVDRCIFVTPRHETEAWCLADQAAIRRALGLPESFGFPELPGLPRAVEGLLNPKALAANLVGRVHGGRRRAAPKFPYAVVAQLQDIGILRQLPAFTALDQRVRLALRGLGYPNL